MVDYVNSSVDMYNAHPGNTKWHIREKVHCPWYGPTQSEIDALSVLPGVFGGSAASLLMKALYCARMVPLDICYTSKHIIKVRYQMECLM